MNARLLAVLSIVFAELAIVGGTAGMLFLSRNGGEPVVLLAVLPLAVVSLSCAVFAWRARRRG